MGRDFKRSVPAAPVRNTTPKWANEIFHVNYSRLT
nr:MAG TPA: hypothetical protein [Caudoviricetes sp.]